VSEKWDEKVALKERDYVDEKTYSPSHRGSSGAELQGWIDDRVDLGDIWSHYCTLSEVGEVVDRGRFRTTASGLDRRFRDLEPVRIAMEAGTHSIWVSEQLRELGHEVIVANVRELRAISHSDRKSDQVDAEELARFARLDSTHPTTVTYRTVAQQETLTLIRAPEMCWCDYARRQLTRSAGRIDFSHQIPNCTELSAHSKCV